CRCQKDRCSAGIHYHGNLRKHHFFTVAEPVSALSLLRVVGTVSGFHFRPQLAGLSFSYV
ncbi:hypothetical protein MRP14_16830, partial [Dickeya dianthicola]|uniref:hypothetical protein n=1 Tax=Dickeya dianthicola TaxID=204039 RepID=UPI001F6048EC